VSIRSIGVELEHWVVWRAHGRVLVSAAANQPIRALDPVADAGLHPAKHPPMDPPM
jgi:hypothetical protein